MSEVLNLESLSHDIVIVGGGPAGITTALALCKAASEVKKQLIILEKKQYPREKICAGAIGNRGIKILEALDADPKVPFVPIKGVAFRSSEGEINVMLKGTIGRVIRRTEFDHALANIAMSRGIRIHDGVTVKNIEENNEYLSVITSTGTIKAKYVVGCDGVTSIVRKAMGLSTKGEYFSHALEVDTEPVEEDLDRRLLSFDTIDKTLTGYIWDFPTIVNGREMVCRGIYQFLSSKRVNIHEKLKDRLASKGLNIDDYKCKYFVERGYDPRDPVANKKMILVGEAAGVDPITGEGISQALEYGFLAGAFINDVIRGSASMIEWQKRVRHSRLGRDLSARRRILALFYGKSRAFVERFIAGCPSAMHIGCQHFANDMYDRKRLIIALLCGFKCLIASFIRNVSSARC